MPWEKQFDKQAALDKALQAFWARGYEATSMQDLVDCMGVNRGSLYATYGDKPELFLAALRMYDEARRRMLAGFEARYTPRESIRRVFLAFIDQVSDRQGNRGCFMTNTALVLAAHDPEIRRIVAEAQEDVEAFFTRMIRKGKASGEIAGLRLDADWVILSACNTTGGADQGEAAESLSGLARVLLRGRPGAARLALGG